MKILIFLLPALFIVSIVNTGYAQKTDTLKKNVPRVVELKLKSSEYQEIFNGSPETIGMYSGLVTLKPGETVGEHNTDEYEEILVIFSGSGQMNIHGGNTMELKYGVIAYCPPHTAHDIICTGKEELKYIYVASKTK
jgi:mannose-6-phosphate isomerase-like protein (cupin superfamily)